MLGKISAWGAIIVGVGFAVFAALELNSARVFDGDFIAPLLVAGLLLVGGYRTLAAKSGGLRLLAGAWGFVAGVLYMVASQVHIGDLALLPVLALAGLGFTVLHQETKK